MQIYGPTHLHGPQGVNAPHVTRNSPTSIDTRNSVDTTDELHLSEQAQLASQLSESPDIRHDRVQALRTAIAEGNYDTEERFSLALDRMLDQIA